MLYRNCHYRYKDQLCEFISFLPNIDNKDRKVRIRFQNNKEVVCSEKDLEEIPLTEAILQSCYQMKTFVRDGKWDILWKLGGKNDITVGEKQGTFYLLPAENVEMVIEILPFEFVQGQYFRGNKEQQRISLLN